MKIRPYVLSALLFAVALIAGCAAMPSLSRYKPIVPVLETNHVVGRIKVPVIDTNYVDEPVTNSMTVKVPRLVITTNFVDEPYTNTVVSTNSYAVNPEVTDLIEKARRANSALNPTPSSPFIDWGLTLAGIGLAGVAKWKSNQAKKATTLRDTLIRAVETAPPGVSETIKSHIATVADLRGVSKELDEAVKKVTDAMADGRLDANELLALAMDPNVKPEHIDPKYHKAFNALRENIPA